MVKKVVRRSQPGPSQNEVLQFIASYKADPKNDGNSPTYREIAHGLGKSIPTVYEVCQRLADKRLITINARGKIVLQGGKYTHRPDSTTP